MYGTRLTRQAFGAALLLACSSTQSPPKSQASASEIAENRPQQHKAAAEQAGLSKEQGSNGIPTTCAGKDPCTPPAEWVTRLCAGSYPSVALYLFRKESPFVRAYLTRRTEAWNASGGVSDTGFVEFDEEVLILRVRKANLGGMQVSGAGDGYDALRWSGTCVTLSAEELTFRRPPATKAAKVEFRFLEDGIKDALREDPRINASYLARRNECKGATSGEVTLKCVKADDELSRAIVDFVRNGGRIPEAERRP